MQSLAPQDATRSKVDQLGFDADSANSCTSSIGHLTRFLGSSRPQTSDRSLRLLEGAKQHGPKVFGCSLLTEPFRWITTVEASHLGSP